MLEHGIYVWGTFGSWTNYIYSACICIASQTVGLFFALPAVLPKLFEDRNKDVHALFAQKLYEVTQTAFSSVVDKTDLLRLKDLCIWLLAHVPAVFIDFGNKPKFHYAFAHTVLSLERHGPSPYWSSFAFEARLGELKRTCLLIGNNKSVALHGAKMAVEKFILELRVATEYKSAVPLGEWLEDKCEVDFRASELGVVEGDKVADVDRFEGDLVSFSRGSFVMPHDFLSNPLLRGEKLYKVKRLAMIQGT